MSKKFLCLTLCIFMIASVILTGCGSKNQPSGNVSDKDTVTVAMSAEPTGFDPQTTLDANAMMIMINIYDTLVDTDGGCSGNIRPRLAETWDISEDGLIYTFHLKDGVKFHNGETMTAKDVVYTIERAKAEPATASYCTMIETVTALDDKTVEVALNMRFANFLQNLGGIFFGIVNEKAVTEAGGDFGRKPVGTGPYELVTWEQGQSVTLKQFDEFYGGEMSIKNVIFKNLPDKSTALIALQNGEVDAFPNSAALDAPTVENDKNLSLYSAPGATITYMGINPTVAPFDNIAIRQAIQCAIDKELIFMGALDGAGVLANSPLNETMMGFSKDNPPVNPYDLEKAKKLMKEGGYENGFSCKLKVVASENRDKVAQIIQAQLKEIGIEVKIEILEKATYFDLLGKGNYEMYVGGLNWPDADNMLTYLYDSKGPFNWGGVYSDQEVDKLLLEARQEIDETKRTELYQKIIEITYENAHKIPLYFANQYFSAKKSLSGIKIIDNCYFPVEKWSWAE